ncbi:Anti-silencing [Thalictrum thalictroides]|uniref:Anti-silencing n=1 Tax=Thalictrum thalictroides TaxID=46969 RepID=A0A7J6VL47_THATH|nr:Anti-silencing [Thalictrum thalictroides]
MTSNEGSQLCPKLNSPGTSVNITTDAMAGHLALKDDKDMKVSFVKQKPLSGGNHVADLSVEIKETAVPAVIKEQVSSHEETLPRPAADSCNDIIKTSSTSISKVEDKKLKSSNDLGVLDDRPSKKARLDSPVNKDTNGNSSVKLPEDPSSSSSLAINKDKNENSLLKKHTAKTNEGDVLHASGTADGAFESQAFVIFNSRDAADTAVTKLEEGCLMLPNGRPLVACWGSPPSSEKRSTFVGHLFIDKCKLQQREAISTSHCSQPNTIEYDMAMEWCLMQKKCERMWKQLYKQHGDELKKMKATLKSK